MNIKISDFVDTSENFLDVTDIWLKSKTNTYKVKDRLYFEKDNKRYYVDGKNIFLNYSEKEYKVARWLGKTFGGIIYMLPQVKNILYFKTPDYLFKGEYWDLKEILGTSKRNIDSKIKCCKEQAHNFIIDNSKQIITNEYAIKQIIKIYNDPNRKWVDKIMLLENNKLIKVFKRK